eukprot:9897171-Heterocapsa_arctica.AAC.1
MGEVGDQNVECKVPRKMLKPFDSARASANEILEAGQLNSGKEILDALTRKLAFFLQLDRTFIIEIGLVKAMCDTGGAE